MGPLSRLRPLAIIIVTMMLISWSAPVSALDPARAIAQYKHTRWTVADGAPSTIVALAQGKDGYLWIGGADGLYRFDGIRFDHIEAAGPPVRRGSTSAILAARDGTIWVGYGRGGLARYRNGQLLEAKAPAFTAYVMRLVQTRDGTIWAALGRPDQPLLRFNNGQWQQIGTNWNFPREFIISVLAARDGSLWVTTVKSLVVLDAGSTRFRRVGELSHGHAALSEAADGRIWLSDDGGTRALGDAADLKSAYPSPGSPRNVQTLFDHDGNLWGLVTRAGIYRVAAPQSTAAVSAQSARQKVDRYGAADGLTSNVVAALLEDREGNIWVGSTQGLDRFRSANVVVEPTLRNPTPYGDILFSTSDGTVYVGEADAIYRIDSVADPKLIIRNIPAVEAMCEAPDRTLWVILEDRLMRIRQGGIKAIPWKHTTTGGVLDCIVDQEGAIWVNAEFDGLYKMTDGRWSHPVNPASGAFRPEQLIPNSAHKRLVYLHTGAAVEFDPAGKIVRELLAPDAARAMTATYFGEDGLLLSGTFGFGRVVDRKLRTLSDARFPLLREAFGLVQSPAGQTWLIGQGRVIGIASADLRRAFTEPQFSPPMTVLSFADGLPDIELRGSKRAATVGGDGRIWFATAAGVVHIDPAHFSFNRMPPPVVIRGLRTPNRSYANTENLALASGTSRVEISYAALSLTAPEQARFLYRLDGVDPTWVDPGSRREASYTNLAPGHYRFRVIAANNDGVWNRDGASIEFTIAPTFRQSNWFLLMCCAIFALLLWAVYSVRTRQLTAQVRTRLEAQLSERERIARDLHDTLLQGFQGLILRFQSVANGIPAGERTRDQIERALDSADDVLSEGRDSVMKLRAARTADLSQVFSGVAERFEEKHAAKFTLVIEGTPRDLHPVVREELCRIGEEALINAFAHARAASIELAIAYGAPALTLIIRDDGIGIASDILDSGRRQGHFGLTGMRERANQISAAFDVASQAGAGTEISVAVPAPVAYADYRRNWLQRLLGRGRHRWPN